MDGATSPARGRSCYCLSASRPPNVGYGSELQRVALDAGVDAGALDGALDEPEPRSVIAALLAAAAPAPAGSQDAMREELEACRPSELKRRAAAGGVDPAALEAAIDQESPKEALIALILAAPPRTAAVEDRSLALLRAELAPLKMGALQKRALAAGADADAVDEALDAEDVKATLTELIVKGDSTAAPKPALDQAPDDRPHFGTGKQHAQRTNPKSAPRKGHLPPNKHAMISYQWDDQERVVAARETLTKLGVPCWMVIDGGMQQDIYESMAEGVERAACVVCFLSQKYQDSVSAQAPSHHNLISKGCF